MIILAIMQLKKCFGSLREPLKYLLNLSIEKGVLN